MKRYQFNRNRDQNSPQLTPNQIEIVPKEGRLFLTCYDQDYYSYGNGLTYKFEPNSYQIIEKRVNTVTLDLNRPFYHFYQAVELGGKYYGICKQYLTEFDKFETKQLCQIPAECNEKYKIFIQSGEIFVLDDKGSVYVFRNRAFVKVSLPQFAGDCYATSAGQVSVVVNSTTKALFITVKGVSAQLPFDQYITIDLLTPYYMLGHSDQTNTLMDFTSLISSALQTGKIELNLLRSYSSGRRTRDIEWNRVGQFLRVFGGILLLGDDHISLFQELNTTELTQRLARLLMNNVQSPTTKKQELVEIGEPIDPKPMPQPTQQLQQPNNPQVEQMQRMMEQLQGMMKAKEEPVLTVQALRPMDFIDRKPQPMQQQAEVQLSTNGVGGEDKAQVVNLQLEVESLKMDVEKLTKHNHQLAKVLKIVVSKLGADGAVGVLDAILNGK